MKDKFKIIATITLATAMFSCYPQWTKVHYDSSQMNGQQSVRSGVRAPSGMRQGLGALISRSENRQGTAFQIMGEAGSGFCNDDTLEINVDGDYRQIQSSDYADYNYTCLGGSCFGSTQRFFIIPDDVVLQPSSVIRISWCGLNRQLTERSVERFSEVHNERFD